MSKKSKVPLRIAPLQRLVAELITDPREQKAIDKLRKRGKRKQGGRKAKPNRNGADAESTQAKRKD